MQLFLEWPEKLSTRLYWSPWNIMRTLKLSKWPIRSNVPSYTLKWGNLNLLGNGSSIIALEKGGPVAIYKFSTWLGYLSLKASNLLIFSIFWSRSTSLRKPSQLGGLRISRVGACSEITVRKIIFVMMKFSLRRPTRSTKPSYWSSCTVIAC